ncbi:MAG: hypothetical protein H7Y38_08220 [Armatimonadetes bacterium]|nr:hypothetical protein [Armatimonadota bacterium]
MSYDRSWVESVENVPFVGGEGTRKIMARHMPLPLCPQCGKTMWNAGIHFKPPKQSDVKQWAKVGVLAAHGFRYDNARCCGWYGPGARPRKLNDVSAFVTDQKNVSCEDVALQVRLARKVTGA